MTNFKEMRMSNKIGKAFSDIFTKEVYDRLKQGESFRMNLETMQLEELPEIVEIPRYRVVIYGIKVFSGIRFAWINDFTDLLFPFEWLETMTYEELLKKLS